MSEAPKPTPLCSVIIPVYNHADHLRRAVTSALEQTCRSTEVVVVDDGSTDDTPQVVRGLPPEVICLRQDNGGLGRARNAGIVASRGSYLQFLDADDWIQPWKLAGQSGFLEANPQFDVVYSDCGVIGPTGSREGNASRALHTDDVVGELVRTNLMPVHAALVRRAAVLEAGLFDEAREAQEDWDLWLRLALRGSRFAYLPGDSAVYYQPASQMVTNPLLMYRRAAHLLQKHGSNPALRALGNRYVRSLRAHQNLLLATRAYNNGWWADARRHLWRAAMADPRVMSLGHLACVPKALAHQMLDIAKRKRIVPER